MKISSEGIISNVTFMPSPNCDNFPVGGLIDLLVIHHISLPPDHFGGDGVIELFTNQLDPNEHPYYATIINLKVSAHVFIRRDGHVIQFVPLTKRAWHAGPSEFCGRQACNDFSLGIELEGSDTAEFIESQYQQLAKLTAAICKFNPNITRERIVGHSDIAPGRKTDPGAGFDWGKYFSLLDERSL